MAMNGCHAFHAPGAPFAAAPLVNIERNLSCAPTPQLSDQVVVIGGGTQPGFFTAPPLSDADVERIARRVVELLREDSAR